MMQVTLERTLNNDDMELHDDVAFLGCSFNCFLCIFMMEDLVCYLYLSSKGISCMESSCDHDLGCSGKN